MSDDAPKKFNKVIVGFVVQEYVTLDNGTHVCVGQTFEAGEVQYDNEDCDVIDIDTDKEVYCPMDMIQPKPIPS